MDTSEQKWSLLTLLIFVFSSLIPISAVTSHAEGGANSLTIAGHILADTVVQTAKVFHNQKGLRNEISINGPLIELNAISSTKTETIDELIESISIWIPKMYSECFLVNPRCIIVLETKINEEHKAEIRFGVAMECVPKLEILKTEFI